MSATDPDQQELERLGRSIRQIRNEQGINSADLAQAASVDETTIQALEAGQLDPPYDLLVAIAQGLGVHPATLVIRTEESGEEEDDR